MYVFTFPALVFPAFTCTRIYVCIYGCIYICIYIYICIDVCSSSNVCSSCNVCMCVFMNVYVYV